MFFLFDNLVTIKKISNVMKSILNNENYKKNIEQY